MTLDTAETIYITAEGVVGVMNIVSNFIVLTAILKTPTLHTVPNVFIVNLTIADIFVGLSICPLAAIFSVGIEMEFENCLRLATAILVFTNASIICLVGVSFERFFAIKKPFEYTTMLTVRRAIIINVFIWLISLLFGLVPRFAWHEEKDKYNGQCSFRQVVTLEYMVYFQAVGVVVIPMTVNFCVYAYIVHTVHQHEMFHRSQRNLFIRMSTEQRASRDKLKKDWRAVKLFISINVLFAITWLPLNLINVIANFCSGCLRIKRGVIFGLIVLNHANSSINPFLYAHSNTSIRKAVLRLLGIRRRDNIFDSRGRSTFLMNIRLLRNTIQWLREQEQEEEEEEEQEEEEEEEEQQQQQQQQHHQQQQQQQINQKDTKMIEEVQNVP